MHLVLGSRDKLICKLEFRWIEGGWIGWEGDEVDESLIGVFL